MSGRARRLSAVTIVVAATVVLAGPVPATGAAGPAPATYTNPVTEGVVDTFPDPATIRGKDGHFYAYGTQNPVFQSRGEDGERILPILRSDDLVHWSYAGEVFTPETQPGWHDGSRLWAPDVRYLDGRYHLYYSVPGRDTVGLATAPTPTGPWTDEGAVLAEPSGCDTGNIDQAQFTDTDGTRYLYWGSYDTICVARMNAAATRVEGQVTEVAKGRRMEGGFVVRRNGFYYLFYSDAGCCDGAFSGYQVKVGRSTSPTGPFVDDEGTDLRAPTSKGGVVVGANGNHWIGPGHNGFMTDLAGQDWLTYHGIPSEDPDFDPVTGVDKILSKRPMLIDRLDWIDGWPVVRAGAGPSSGPQRAPATTPALGGTFNDGSFEGLRPEGPRWRLASDMDSQGHVRSTGRRPSTLVSARPAPRDVRAEADLRVDSAGGAAGLTLGYRGRGDRVTAWLDKRRHALVLDVVTNGKHRTTATALPERFRFDTWHTVVAESRGARLRVTVSSDRLHDPEASIERRLAAPVRGAVGVAARDGAVAADNVTATPLFEPVTTRVSQREPGALLPAFSDDFDGADVPGTTPESPWRWVRGPAEGVALRGGALSWPTQDAELSLGDNTASVLRREAPRGDYTVETRLRFAPTEDAQQAGLILYGDDDRWFKLVHSVLPLNGDAGGLTQVTEFGKEGARPTTTPPTPVANAPMFLGPPSATLWLRLSYHVDSAADETEVRAQSSRDGEHWGTASAWTLPGTDPLSPGLISLNRAGATASFDYVHTYRGSVR